ncbi:putative homeodomain transcription factor 1 [Oryzias latipes]|uniref:Putative homeodomain transcription factor 1 n=1 Tax=Oryzias latipes TaxID=8090 RepID=H2MQX1_ORYLA|nr:putative homeodomain transcription factor 1 [Oryzias latipes]XP_011473952.1 putative homeodomain transcription factor 1 [Oryzias latipes]XP_020559246.1 putative homeodomain transcription factor 1 [Oryzias latipes]XP_020559247.1 putative homeodomain transcription factor 1 [Oryzias latipes]XP_023811043.1 putative homeodomain transcription factor 1 [Oryzias latipes]XP_023811044.1 putative homeodomain transcription factor 1 [Oryzias latipes]
MTMTGIAWYQEKIRAYDQQVWEKSLEKANLGLENKPKKTGYIKPDLIDVDLVRGSTFSKAKPQSPWTALARKGLVRVLLFPFFFNWWIQVTSRSISICILLLYLMQVAAVLLYLEVPKASASETFGPMCLMLLLGTVHCQIVSTESSQGPMGYPAACSSPARRRRPRKGRSLKKPEDTNDSWNTETQGVQPCDSQLEERTNKSQSGFGASDEFSSEEEEQEEGPQSVKTIRPSHLCNHPAMKVSGSCSSVRKRNLPSSIKSRPQEGGEVCAAAREVTNHRIGAGSHPASDTDDNMWEELLQGPDSASTGSSDTEGDEGLNAEVNFSQNTTQSSDEETPQQGITSSQLTWLQACHPSKDRVSAIIWEQGECKKADLSVLEMSGIILSRVKMVEQGLGYLVLGGFMTATLALLPFAFRLAQRLDVSSLGSYSLPQLLEIAAGANDAQAYAFFFITTVQRVCFTGLFFFMMCVAERTYKQRLLFAKYFSHLTSARKAKKSEVPHFRLKKVQNIKMWLSLRSFLRRRGPQRSVDVIVSTIFLSALSVSVIVCAQLLHSPKTFLESLTNWECMMWGSSLLLFLLRLATLGSETNSKYSNSSVLLTEQINLYLKMEKKPNKKEQLNIVNNVLKLATKLMKELDTPFRLLSLTVNPLIYTMTKVVILSAVSAVVSKLLGFNIRLWKIKP